MSDSQLGPRLTTAAVLLGALALLLLWANFFCTGRWMLMLVGLLVAICCATEFSRICTSNAGQGPRPLLEQLIYAIVPLLSPVLLASYLARQGLCTPSGCAAGILAVIAIAALVSFLAALLGFVTLGRHSLEEAKRLAAELFPAVLLIGFCGSFLLGLAVLPQGVRLLAWLIVVVSINDSAAYFAGTKIGGAKLASALSPAKTYTGTLAGLAAGLAAGLLFKGLISAAPYSVWYVVFVFLVVITAQAGDLAKSYFKRLYDQKDSGALFPGHGGMLDRVDGVLAASPLVFIFSALRIG